MSKNCTIFQCSLGPGAGPGFYLSMKNYDLELTLSESMINPLSTVTLPLGNALSWWGNVNVPDMDYLIILLEICCFWWKKQVCHQKLRFTFNCMKNVKLKKKTFDCFFKKVNCGTEWQKTLFWWFSIFTNSPRVLYRYQKFSALKMTSNFPPNCHFFMKN